MELYYVDKEAILAYLNTCEGEGSLHQQLKTADFSLIHGGPTSGKSYMIKNFSGWTDSDLITVEVCPTFFERHLNESKADVTKELVNNFVAYGVNHKIHFGDRVFTNLWHSDHFVRRINPLVLANGKIPISFMRDPKDAFKLHVARGSSFLPPDTFEMWMRSYMKYGKLSFASMFILNSGEFMYDFITADGRMKDPLISFLFEGLHNPLKGEIYAK